LLSQELRASAINASRSRAGCGWWNGSRGLQTTLSQTLRQEDAGHVFHDNYFQAKQQNRYPASIGAQRKNQPSLVLRPQNPPEQGGPWHRVRRLITAQSSKAFRSQSYALIPSSCSVGGRAQLQSVVGRRGAGISVSSGFQRLTSP